MKEIQIFVNDQDSAEELRTITTANVSWLLGAGWMFYLGSLLLNLVYYLIHPSSPEMWTWGAEEELEVWSRPDEGIESNTGQASDIEMAELLPKDSESDK